MTAWPISDVLMGVSSWDNRMGMPIPRFVYFSFRKESMRITLEVKSSGVQEVTLIELS